MGYNFEIIHRKARMMRDVDALSRRFGKAITLYVIQTHVMRSRNILARPVGYSLDYFHASSKPQHVLPSGKQISKHEILPMKEDVHNSLDIPSGPSAKICIIRLSPLHLHPPILFFLWLALVLMYILRLLSTTHRFGYLSILSFLSSLIVFQPGMVNHLITMYSRVH